MPWSRTSHHDFALTPAQLWRVVGDPARLPDWNPAVAGVEVDGDSAKLTLPREWMRKLHSRTAPPARIIDVVENERITLEQKQPGGYLRISWSIRTVGGLTRLEQRVECKGLGSRAVVPLIAEHLVENFPTKCARLYTLVADADPHLLKIVIAGASGALGTALAADLVTRGHEVVSLTREVTGEVPYREVPWDGRTLGEWTNELANPANTAVVNLAGRSVSARPTPANIRDMTTSRVNATRALVTASQRAQTPLAAWLQASTTAIWGDLGERRATEATPVDVGLPQQSGVAEAWERAALGANAAHEVTLRSAVVIGRDQPITAALARLTKVGAGGPAGAGRQWFSWIALDDWLRVARAALGIEPGITLPDGVVVASSPYPVRNVELMRTMREATRTRFALPSPEFAIVAGGALIGTDPAMLLTGRHVTSTVLPAAGFRFEHPTLTKTLKTLFT